MLQTYNKKLGILMILISALSFSLMNVFARMAGDIPVMQKTFFRNIVAILFICTYFGFKRKKVKIRSGCIKFHILRSLFGTLSVIGNFYAVDHMLLSDATMLLELSPFFIIIFSAIILKEKAAIQQYALIALALFGAGLVLKPSAGVYLDQASFVAIAGAIFAGIAYTMVRLLSIRGEDNMIIIFVFSVFSSLFCVPFLFVDNVSLSYKQVILLLGAAVCGCCGQFSVTAAYRYAPAAEISIFDYTQIIFAACFGWIFFQQVADEKSYIGYMLILLAAALMYLVNKKQIKTG